MTDSTDWFAALRERATDPADLAPYRLAISMEGSPLSAGRRVYALADVLGVQPGELMMSLKHQYGEDQVTQRIDEMEQIVVEACQKSGL